MITGGHADSADGDDVVDLLFDGASFTELRTSRVGTDMHGTGCTFASALAAGLALGELRCAAAGRAQQHAAGAIAHGIAIGVGASASPIISGRSNPAINDQMSAIND